MGEQKKEIQVWICRLRIVATLAVVMIHTCATRLYCGYDMTTAQSLFLNILQTLCVFSIPMFLMITGSLLLRPEKEITYGMCLKKYIARIAACLFLFGAVYGVMKMYWTYAKVGVGKSFVDNVLYGFVSGETSIHFWYLYALIGIYMILPILKAFVNGDKDGKNIRWALLLLLTFDFVTPLIEGYTGAKIAFYIPVTYTVFYPLLGYYLSRHQRIGIKIDIAAIIVVVAILVMADVGGTDEGRIISYSSPFAAVLAAAIFDLFRHTKSGGGNVALLWKIDRLCFGVYLIHPIFISLLFWIFGLTPVSFGGFYPLTTIGLWLAYCLCSFAGTWVMVQIPFLKRLLR